MKNKIASAVNYCKQYWKEPPSGRHMSIKEIVSLSVGGMGVKFVVYCVQNMILYIGNTLIGNTIGISFNLIALYVFHRHLRSIRQL